MIALVLLLIALLFRMAASICELLWLERTWSNLYDLRNHLAHSRLPDIDEGLVRRFTWSRLGSLRETVRHHLRSGS